MPSKRPTRAQQTERRAAERATRLQRWRAAREAAQAALHDYLEGRVSWKKVLWCREERLLMGQRWGAVWRIHNLEYYQR